MLNNRGEFNLAVLNDYHFSQVFFVAGHLAIKMLIYLDQQEEIIKNSYDKSGHGQIGMKEENKNEQDDLDLICGGKEADIADSIDRLNYIRDKELI